MCKTKGKKLTVFLNSDYVLGTKRIRVGLADFRRVLKRALMGGIYLDAFEPEVPARNRMSNRRISNAKNVINIHEAKIGLDMAR